MLQKINYRQELDPKLLHLFEEDTTLTGLLNNFRSCQRCTYSYVTDRTTLFLLERLAKQVNCEPSKNIHAQALFEVACGQTVFPHVSTLKRLGFLDVEKFADVQYCRDFIAENFPDSDAVIPGRLKEGMMQALYVDGLGVISEKMAVSLFLNRTAKRIKRHIAALQTLWRTDVDLSNSALTEFFTKDLKLPRFRGLLVCRVLGHINRRLFSDASCYETGTFARRGLGLVIGCDKSAASTLEKSSLGLVSNACFASLLAAVQPVLADLERELSTTIMADLKANGLEFTSQTLEHMLCEFRKLCCGTFSKDAVPDTPARRQEYLDLFEFVQKNIWLRTSCLSLAAESHTRHSLRVRAMSFDASGAFDLLGL